MDLLSRIVSYTNYSNHPLESSMMVFRPFTQAMQAFGVACWYGVAHGNCGMLRWGSLEL